MLSEDKQLLDSTFAAHAKYLDAHYTPGFGIFPSSDPWSNYFNQVWARDAAHAATHYFARTKPEAVIDSLATLLAHQRADGALPSRVEREYEILKLAPGLRWLAGPAFRAIEGRWRGRTERPVHEGRDSAGGEDTVPLVLIAAGELFKHSAEGRVFVEKNFEKFARAADFFRAMKVDPADSLAVMTRPNPDWADTVLRRGKLATVNLWWARGLRAMADVAKARGEMGVLAAPEAEKKYREEFKKTREGILAKLYIVTDSGPGADVFFRATADDSRLDTVASIHGALYFLNVNDALAVERTLKRRVERTSGLQNFDPPYLQRDIHWAPRGLGLWLYHNKFVWPWVTLENIFLKAKIALGHSDEAIRAQYQQEAVEGLIKIAKLFEMAGGAYEVFEPDEPRRGETRWYHPPKNFMGSMVAYQAAYARLKNLGWI